MSPLRKQVNAFRFAEFCLGFRVMSEIYRPWPTVSQIVGQKS